MSERRIKVREVRFFVDGVPRGEPQATTITEEPVSDWSEPANHPIFRNQHQQERVVPYVPESEIERYRAVVLAAIELEKKRHDEYLSSDQLGTAWAKLGEALVANGFITKEGEVLP